MKKVLSVVIALAMLVSFAACGEAETSGYSLGLNKYGMYDVDMSEYVTLPDYKNIAVPAEYTEVSEEEVQNQINDLLSSSATENRISDRAVANGDMVNIDYEGYIDGVAFKNGSAEDRTVTIGVTNFIDDFLDQLIGHMPGEKIDVNVTFPAEYPNDPSLAGKDALFKVNINYILEKILPELTDEFVKENWKEHYNVTTVEELKAYVSDTLLTNKLEGFIDNYLLDNAEVSQIPNIVRESMIESVRNTYTDMAEYYGTSVETLAAQEGYSTLDELIAGMKSDIEDMAKSAMIYQAIASDMKMKVKNVEVADYFEESIGSRDYSAYTSHYGLPYLKKEVIRYNIIKFVKENSVK